MQVLVTMGIGTRPATGVDLTNEEIALPFVYALLSGKTT